MEDLLTEIDDFLEQTKMADTTFGRKAVNDGKFVARLRDGGECLPRTATRARNFIQEQVEQFVATS
ncbi:hypothetical protein [Pelagibacterium sp.]|uniref:hypothetical protein n=1 Tax=Pelagibacterium sp. TaxID=1967288 RepID=UPI003A906A5C